MTIYGYARESTRRQELGLTAQVQELEKSGCDHIVKDLGQSGETNLQESEAWLALADKLRPGDVVKVWSQSRLGRKSYEVQFTVGRLIEKEVTVHILQNRLVLDNLDNLDQNLSLAFTSVTDHNERVEIRKRTKKALQVLKDAGVTLGRKPVFSSKEVAEIQRLRALGIGYNSIGKIVQWKSADGKSHITNPKTIKAALSPEYVTREVWEARNRLARASM